MANVRVLPSELVNQIAAGEVVERPASVVKELVENSLDAGATQIRVAIRDGGISSIHVSDDGSGMSREDARLAFERHATSKLATLHDLACIETLGFRGEALPSIASVARVRMCTRRREDALGTELVGEGAGIATVRPIACAEGTALEVAELFGRVPARRKFLKNPVTEASQVGHWLERMALVRPDVRFELERDGRRAGLWLPTAEPRERVIAVLPPGTGEALVPVAAEHAGLSLRGFVSPTHVMRSGPGELFVYVNGRPVRDRVLQFAVRDAYRDALPPGRYPVAVLFLGADPELVDVNVHPAKWEVRFRDPRAVTDLLRRAIGSAVRGGSAPERPAAFPGLRGAPPEPREPSSGLGLFGASAAADAPGDAYRSTDSPRAPWVFSRLRYLGQALGLYLVLEGDDGLVLLDQHAAHERVLFERLRRGFAEDKLERQELLLPLELELSRADADTVAAHESLLERAGIGLEPGPPGPRGTVPVRLRALPALLAERAGTDWPALLRETASLLREPAERETRDGLERALHDLFATAACHSAVRKGDRLDARAVTALLAGLDQEIWFANCPHGRPVALSLDRAELERRFLRRA
ncbi:MAG TPA: DNA mismatch repair endonuclease MutL [Myxococcota bacterium]|nr:DNA mismatch repair endonuclease MutL [Myxococcota bacterium]